MHVAPSEIVSALQASRFGFEDKGIYLRKGLCPSCDKKTLYVLKEKPYVLYCERLKNCAYEENIKDALPELFTNYADRYPSTPENRDATAHAYLGLDRGFDISKMQGWYDQGSYPHKGKQIPTVRFYLDAEKTRYWERLIGVSGKEGLGKAYFGGQRKTDGSLFKGDVWTPPEQSLAKGDTCFIVEGIFHAIALFHAGYKVAASFSANHYPAKFLADNAKKQIKWVWGLDNDPAGKPHMKEFHKRLKEAGERSSVCLAPYGKDWDDLHREHKLNHALVEKGKYNGLLFLAETVEEKAFYMYRQTRRTNQLFDFDNALYSIKLSATFEKELLVEASAYNPEASAGETAEEKADFMEVFLHSDNGLKLYKEHCEVDQISNVNPKFLYMERDEILDEQRYMFSVDYANGQKTDLIGLEGSAITSPDSFHKALLNRSRGGTFDGDIRQLKKLRNRWLNKHMLTVSAVPYIGYEKSVNAYIYQDHAWHKGRKIAVNDQGYFTINRQGVKTGLQGIHINTKGEFSSDWINDFAKAFHYQGLCTLAFWVGSLFVQQIRQIHKTFPFLELTGEPGSGKSTILEFLWKCVGRDDYEGFDLLKASNAGRRRAFSQVSNLPVVIIESDRDSGEKDARQKQFCFDEVKPFYNGRGTGTLGVSKRGNETDESIFQGALLISQNAEVEGSQALLERIVHCHADKKHHKEGTREIARWFERQTTDTVGGFLDLALSQETQILDKYQEQFDHYEQAFAKSIKNERITKTHAQIAACAGLLPLLFPKLQQKTVDSIADYLLERAQLRENRLTSDHPLLEQFWDIYDYVTANSGAGFPDMLNHSADEKLIALNLNEVREKAQHAGQQALDLGLLKKLLPTGKKHKFIEANKAIRSKHRNTIIKCWVFSR